MSLVVPIPLDQPRPPRLLHPSHAGGRPKRGNGAERKARMSWRSHSRRRTPRTKARSPVTRSSGVVEASDGSLRRRNSRNSVGLLPNARISSKLDASALVRERCSSAPATERLKPLPGAVDQPLGSNTTGAPASRHARNTAATSRVFAGRTTKRARPVKRLVQPVS